MIEESEPCPVHDNQKHGYEAEELRSGIEEVISNFDGREMGVRWAS